MLELNLTSHQTLFLWIVLDSMKRKQVAYLDTDTEAKQLELFISLLEFH